MRNGITFLLFCSLAIFAMVIGMKKGAGSAGNGTKFTLLVPDLGKIEILNGCGIPGAGKRVEDFLRKKGFDVKKTSDAPTWNYPYTIVVSRTKDMSIAQKIADVLHTEKLILVRTGDDLYDVSIFIGSDFGELIR
jgi:hypothetical protein